MCSIPHSELLRASDMNTATRTRLSLVEYGSPADLFSQLPAGFPIDRDQLSQLLNHTGARIASSLGLTSSPISADRRTARAKDFAGLVRLAPNLELEVAPKFLGSGIQHEGWREDFFFLSTLSRHGRLLAADRLSSSSGSPRDLSTLVGRSIVSMYTELQRRPVRSYRRTGRLDFFIDGEPDPIDLAFPSPEGFEQQVVEFDQQNEWNSRICAAARLLLPEVSDPSTAGSLARIIEDLSPHLRPPTRTRPLPSRHRAWGPLHELSVDILNGLGVNYRAGHSHTPGYVVYTWKAWEDLLSHATRLAFGNANVLHQHGFRLGSRTKADTPTPATLSVYPDCIIKGDGSRPTLIIDAKYKSNIEKGSIRISESDIYESIAFSKASGISKVVLAYPMLATTPFSELGSCIPFERVNVEDIEIFGIQVDARTISKKNALNAFSNNLSKNISKLF